MSHNAKSDDIVKIELREGLDLILHVQPQWTPQVAFQHAWACSVLLKGKPVCVKGVLPDVTLHIASRLEQHPGLVDFLAAAWPHAYEQMQTWLRCADREAYCPLFLPYCQAWMAQSGKAMPPAAVHIEWRHCT
jgi:hypothetical protein